MVGAAHRRTPHAGVPAYVEPDSTDQCETPEEVTRMRARKTTEQRVTRLEAKHDALAGTVAETKALVSVVNAKTDGQTRLIEEIQRGVNRIADRDDVTFGAQVDVHKAQRLDTIDAVKARRWLGAKIAASVASGGMLYEAIHWIAGKL